MFLRWKKVCLRILRRPRLLVTGVAAAAIRNWELIINICALWSSILCESLIPPPAVKLDQHWMPLLATKHQARGCLDWVVVEC